MAGGELRLQQMGQAAGNPQRFYLALGGSRSAVRISKYKYK